MWHGPVAVVCTEDASHAKSNTNHQVVLILLFREAVQVIPPGVRAPRDNESSVLKVPIGASPPRS